MHSIWIGKIFHCHIYWQTISHTHVTHHSYLIFVISFSCYKKCKLHCFLKHGNRVALKFIAKRTYSLQKPLFTHCFVRGEAMCDSLVCKKVSLFMHFFFFFRSSYILRCVFDINYKRCALNNRIRWCICFIIKKKNWHYENYLTSAFIFYSVMEHHAMAINMNKLVTQWERVHVSGGSVEHLVRNNKPIIVICSLLHWEMHLHGR